MSSKLPARREKPHSSKPYDRPKSFLQRVGSHVANYLPSWMNPNSWVVSGPRIEDKPSDEYVVADEETGEETEEEGDIAGLSEQSTSLVQKAHSHRTTSELTSPGSVSFTRKPLERTTPTSQQIIANGDDHSDNSETSASTSGCSSLAPSQERKRATTTDARVGTHLKGLQVSKHHLEKIQQQLNSKPLFTIPGKEIAQRSTPVLPLEDQTDSVTVNNNNTLGSQKTREKSQKRVSVENYHPVENADKDMESSSTRTSLWSEEEKNSESNKRPRTTRPQAVAPNKRPCFSVSAFGSPLRVSRDRTRQTSESSTSPFCESHTLYGGASAYKRARVSTPYNSVLHAEAMKVRHSGSREVLSSAAQKVLKVLENMSTPLTDAKKIPVENVSRDFALSYTPSIYARKPLRQDTPRAPGAQGGPPRSSFPVATSSSQQPTPLLAMLNQTAPSRNVDLGTQISRPDYEGTGKSIGAIRARVSQPVRSSKHLRVLDEDPPYQPALPRIPLIPEETLSSVSFKFPVLTSTPIVEASPTVNTKKLGAASVSTPVISEDKAPAPKKFTFSSPIENRPPENVSDDTTYVKDSSFLFRSPIVKTSSPSESEKSVPAPCPTASTPTMNFNFAAPGGAASVSPLRRKKPVEQISEEPTDSGGLKPAAELVVGGSVMDILGKALGGGVGAKDKKVTQEQTGFGSAFQKKSTEWECSVCMVRNKDSVPSCVACTTPKPSLKPTGEGFGSRFAPPLTSWCCPTCMVNNTESEVNCVACSERKPGSTVPSAVAPVATPQASGFKIPVSPSKQNTSIFVKPTGKWECDTCLVRNDEGLSKCAACETQRPTATTNAGVKQAFTGFKFGQQPKEKGTEAATSSPFKFGLTDKLPTKNSTLSGNKSEDVKEAKATSVTGFKFGAPSFSETTKTSEGFKFGVSASSDTPKINEGFKFGVASSAETTKLPSEGFKFGVSTSSEITKAQEGFKFGAPVNKNADSSTDSSSASGFKFGSSTNGTSASAMFKFGAPNEPLKKAKNVQTGKDSEASKIACDTVSSLATSTGKVERETGENKDVKSSSTVGFVFGGQAATSENLETTPVLTFGNKTVDAPKQTQETVALDKLDAPKLGIVASVAPNGGNVPVSLFGVTAPKPSVTVSQLPTAPLVTESVGPKPAEFSGFKFGAANVQSELKTVAASATESNNAEKVSAASMFKFGGQMASNVNKELPGIAALPVATAAPSTLQFSFKGKDSDSSQVTQPATSVFGALQATSTKSGGLPSFATATTNASVPSFGMGSQPLASSTSSATAGLPAVTNASGNAAANTNNSLGGFVFGSSTPAAQAPAPNPGSFKFTFGNDAAKPVSFFGSTPSSTTTVPPSTPFCFGKPTMAPSGNMVQQQPQQPQQTVPMFSFGSASATPVNTSNSGAFGGGQAPKPVFGFAGQQSGQGGSGAPAFGGQQQQPAASVSAEPFRFGAAAPTMTGQAAPTTGMFPMEAPKPALPAPNSSNAAPNSLFRFGTPQPDSVPSQQPLFGAAQSQAAAGSSFTFGSPALPPMATTFGQADSSTGAGGPFVFGSTAPNTGVNPVQPAASVSPFNFQPANATTNPFNVTGNNNNTRPVRKATRRLGLGKKK